MNFNSARILGACLIAITSISLYSSQAQSSSHIQKSVGSQSSSSVELCSAPVTHASEAQTVQVLANDADLFDLGKAAEQSGNLRLAAWYFHKAAADNNEGALYYLLEFYKKYQNIFPDALNKRFRCLVKIAIDSWLPDERACYGVAQCYETGYGVEKNISHAFAWYKKAADEGEGRACYKVGLFYESGVVVEADKEKAFRYFKKAADLYIESPEWVAKTARKVAECYAIGYGVQKNPSEAFQYALLAGKAFERLEHE